jgi:hypothetical protein
LPNVPQSNPVGACQFYDALVAKTHDEIDNKSVVPAIQAIVATSPDVRVFNLSFDTRLPLDQMEVTNRKENLFLVQDLDNIVFRDDILVVVAAGNSARGTPPSVPYPGHYDDANWQLGAWARSFNALTCGSFVDKLVPDGLVKTVGWPSPFTRLGPGLCDSPKPDFSDHGGNTTEDWQFASGLGVFGLNSRGLWEDNCGTSYAAPLLARQAAFAFRQLQQRCLPGARPYAVTVKAFLAITAAKPDFTGAVKILAERALGRGRASAERLTQAASKTAILMWQGLLEGPAEVARVTVPIPRAWLTQATQPRMRLIVSWDSPVNAAVSGLWATRKLSALLKPGPDSPALRGTQGGHPSYPVIDKEYDLHKLPAGVTVSGDMWLLELSYEQIADYHIGMVFTPQQRVAFAVELFDSAETPVSPQQALQALPSAVTMNRLSIPPQSIKTPVIIRPIG